jgi:cobalamin biosynthesis Mg chelatase CobN
VIELLKEMQEHGYSVDGIPTIKCKLFEDNSGAFEQAKTAKYRPRTRHINAAWHHFRSYVANRLIHIHSIQADWKLGDTFTKQVSKEDFLKFRRLIFGW